MNKTASAKKEKIKRKWHFIDASDRVLGRLATEVAELLIGKDKPDYSPNQLMGDKVVVTNSSKILVTGKKCSDKNYYRHSNYPGGLKRETLEDVMRRNPSKVITMAVDGMLPRNKLRKRMISNLYVYPDSEHPHKAQQGDD